MKHIVVIIIVQKYIILMRFSSTIDII